MALELIKKGDDPKKLYAYFQCGHCNSEYKAQKCDGKATYDQRDGNFITFKCEVCREMINVCFSKFTVAH